MTVYYKMGQILLRNETATLQIMSGFLLENETVITNCNDFITKCGSCYKVRCLLQIVTVQCLMALGKVS